MSRVFVLQRPVYKDPETRQWVDKYDLSPAEAFGELVVVLPMGNVPADVGTTVREMQVALADFGPDDHLLAIGDPVAIGLAVLIAAGRSDVVSMLKWDARARSYRAVRLATRGLSGGMRS